MSYPGAVGYSTNLACDTALQRSTDQFNFQLNTGGGGSSESNLQSPASVIPAADGSVSLTMAATGGTAGGPQGSTLTISSDTGTGSANLIITDTTGNLAFINMTNTAGGDSIIQMGEAASQVYLYTGSTAGQLEIQNGNTGAPYAVFDTINNNVTLGNLASAGTINLDAATVVKDSTAPGNGLLLSPSSATSSLISQTIASGGTVTIGSSATAAPNTLVVSDSGANTAAVVIGGNSGASLVIKGGVGSAAPTIFPNVSDAGTLNIGSSSSVPNSIVLTDSAGVDTGRTVINNFVPPSNTDSGVLLTNIPVGQTDLPQPNPLVSGLYIFAVSPGPNDVRVGVTTMAYYNAASATWRVGGSVYGIPVGAGNVSLLPKNDQSVMTVSNTTGGALALANVVYCRLFTGTIGGW